jgi:hypothetical protein
MAVFRIFANAFLSSILYNCDEGDRALSASWDHEWAVHAGNQMMCQGRRFPSAGLFVDFSVSSGVVEPHVGAGVVFCFMSLLACIVAVPSATSLEQSRDLDNREG